MATNLTKAEADVIKATEAALLQLGEDIQGQVTKPFTEWAKEVAPAITKYALLTTAGNPEAAANLRILRALAVAKASKFTIIGLNATGKTMGDIAIFAAKLIVGLLI